MLIHWSLASGTQSSSVWVRLSYLTRTFSTAAQKQINGMQYAKTPTRWICIHLITRLVACQLRAQPEAFLTLLTVPTFEYFFHWLDFIPSGVFVKTFLLFCRHHITKDNTKGTKSTTLPSPCPDCDTSVPVALSDCKYPPSFLNELLRYPLFLPSYLGNVRRRPVSASYSLKPPPPSINSSHPLLLLLVLIAIGQTTPPSSSHPSLPSCHSVAGPLHLSLSPLQLCLQLRQQQEQPCSSGFSSSSPRCLFEITRPYWQFSRNTWFFCSLFSLNV